MVRSLQCEKSPDAQVCSSSTALRIEWAKGRARSLRWGEEVRLLKEEMRRVSCTLEWRARWWEDRAAGWSELTLDAKEGVQEGVRAYALRQAQVQRSINHSFTRLWDKPLNPPVTREESGEDGPEPFVDPVLESIVESHEDD